MDEMWTRAEIEARYQGEWILIADPEVDKHLQVLGGRVVAHSTDKEEVYERMVELRLRSSATIFAGELPNNVGIILGGYAYTFD